VRHKVGEKETLFSIAKYYGSSMYDVIQLNPGADEGLRMGQVIQVPYGKPLTSAVSRPAQEEPSRPMASLTHKVRPSETIFSISRAYNVSVAEIRAWNALPDDNIKVDQLLRLSAPPSGRAGYPAGRAAAAVDSPNTESSRTNPSRQVAEFSMERIPVVGNEDKVRMEEKGIAELIPGSGETAKFLALHKTAPTGTVIQVLNPMNNVSIFVRVVGQLPPTGDNDKVLIKLSKAAYERLNAIDKRFLVELSYFE
jgi:LysM repeat protein